LPPWVAEIRDWKNPSRLPLSKAQEEDCRGVRVILPIPLEERKEHKSRASKTKGVKEPSRSLPKKEHQASGPVRV